MARYEILRYEVQTTIKDAPLLGTIDKLEDNVNDRLRNGWQLVGGPIAICEYMGKTVIAQALFLPDEQEALLQEKFEEWQKENTIKRARQFKFGRWLYSKRIAERVQSGESKEAVAKAFGVSVVAVTGSVTMWENAQKELELKPYLVGEWEKYIREHESK